MKDCVQRHMISAFTLIELLVILAVSSQVFSVALIELNKQRRLAKRICCNCNLKQVGLSFRTWALDHKENYPMNVTTDAGGSMECFDTGETFRHFEIMSNDLSTPVILVCPQDSRRPAKAFRVTRPMKSFPVAR